MAFNPLLLPLASMVGQSVIGQPQIAPPAQPVNMGGMGMQLPAPPIDRLGMTEEPQVQDIVKDKMPDRPNFFGGFFENLDEGFQSPSRMIGLGLLNQIDPRLAMGGAALQGLGFLGGNRLF